MIRRICKPSKSNSFFLFGARGTGKSTLLRNQDFLKNSIYIDLLDPDLEELYATKPQELVEQCAANLEKKWIVIDEVQKVPKLLDLVHQLMESKKQKFALTGSSSRKLKRGGANLLAGRAFLFHLFPLTAEELGDQFHLDDILNWGSLPKIFEYELEQEKRRYLTSYFQTYLKEEIVTEQIIRNLDPFRLFLPLAAQMDGQIVNYANISKDTGADPKTIQNYYQILEDTNLGIFLNPYMRSVRKVQKQSPKFYFFDCGVKKSLEKMLSQKLMPKTSGYGNAFESWFINECSRQNQYKELDFSLSYLRTKDDVEIDLIIERPGAKTVLVEIKSTNQIDARHVKSLTHFQKDFPGAELICACQEKTPKKIDSVWILPWRDALKEIGLMTK
jgi:predicted AAA+ superfamily ATPase